MTRFSQVTAALRRKSLGQYALLTLCCFVSVLLITAYASMMGSPMVLSVFPEGGDSRKQMTMIFVLAVLGCGVFTTYASGLFFRHKSRDVGILLALGASKDQLRRVLAGELALMSLSACALGALLGTPLAWFIWQGFRLLLVDSEEMALAFDPHAYLLALAFSLFVVVMLFVMLGRFLRRTNILDVVNESRKSEPIRAVPRWYGPLGIILLAAGGFLGYMAPQFFILVLHWYAPDALTALFYLPALAGLYMILLHTVVNGWRRGSSRYRDLITSSMMKFQGRQTVRTMVVVTVLAAGAYFAAFYIPMLSSGTSSTTEDREFDYLFHYRADQDMPGREEVLHLAEEMGVTVTRYAQQSGAVLAYDGYADVVSEGPLGATYDVVYCEETASDVFLSESAWNILTGDDLDLEPGTAATVYDRNGDSSGAGNSISLVTNHLTGEQLAVTPAEPLRSTSLLGYRVLDDGDYARITQGLPNEWREVVAVFDVEDEEDVDLEGLSPDEARELLIARLIAYKQFRSAGAALGARLEAEGRMLPRTVGPDPEFLNLMPDYLEGISLRSLAVICADIDSRRETFLLEAEHIAPKRLPVALTVASVDRLVRSMGHLSFSQLLDGDATPEVVVVNFLAILDLFKRGMVSVHQDELFGDIEITHIEGADAYELDESVLAELDETDAAALGKDE